MDKEKDFRDLLLRLDEEIVKGNKSHKRLMQMAKAQGLSAADLASKDFLDICDVMIQIGKLSSENLRFLNDVFPKKENARAFKDIYDTSVILTGEDTTAGKDKIEPKGEDTTTGKDKIEPKGYLVKGEIYISKLKHQQRLISIWNEMLDRAPEERPLNKALKMVDKISKKLRKAYVKKQKLISIMERKGIQFYITDGSIQILFDYDSKTSLLRLQEIYHSGELQLLFQDGLITEYVLEECGMEAMRLKIYIAEEEFVRCLAIAGMGNRMEGDRTDSASGEAIHVPKIQEVEDAERKTDPDTTTINMAEGGEEEIT